MKKALCIRNADDIIEAIKDPKFIVDAMFVDRDICEKSENGYLQIIPYITFYNVDLQTGYIKFVHYKRAGSITEKRLSTNISIGFGGHIDSEDDLEVGDVIVDNETTIYKLNIEQIINTVVKAGKREINEELGESLLTNLNIEFNLQDFIFFSSDSKSDVDKVHLGVSIPVELTNEQFELFFKEATINPEEIESISPLSINLGLVLESFNINATLIYISEELGKTHNFENWSCKVLYYISSNILDNIKSKIKYQDLLQIIKSNETENTNSVTVTE